jgi:hypothetical protein
MPRAAVSPETRKIRSARTRNLTAAKRSLTLIEEAAAKHRAALDAGEVPGDGFIASVLKYEAALIQLRLLGTLADGEDEAAANGADEARPDDVALLVQFLLGTGLVPAESVGEDGPLGRLARFSLPDEFLAKMASAPEGAQEAMAAAGAPAPPQPASRSGNGAGSAG